MELVQVVKLLVRAVVAVVEQALLASLVMQQLEVLILDQVVAEREAVLVVLADLE